MIDRPPGKLTRERVLELLADGDHVPRYETPWVACDLPCFAPREPRTLSDAFDAMVHWRDHPRLSGCSHGR